MKKVIAIIIIVLIVYVAGSVFVSYNYLAVNEFSVDTGKCGEAVTAVVISDLHDHEFGADNWRLAEKIEEIQPDLILMDGDMLNEASEDALVPLELIGQLKDMAPIYYALGNHELGYMENGHPELTGELEAAGAVVLDKTYVDIEVNGNKVRIGGMYDYAFGLNGNNDASAAPSDTLSFLQEFQDTDSLKIMLAHRPDSFIFGDASKVWDVDLVVSGHNHGGQVVIPFTAGIRAGSRNISMECIRRIRSGCL